MQLRNNIARACKQLQRDPEEIIIVGITKYRSPLEIHQALESGLCHIGENKVQEALKKYSGINIATKPITKHMVGHLQRNKVRQALEIFDVIQSVDSFRLAESIQRHCCEMDRTVDILIQVNASQEKQKFGIFPQDVFLLVQKISELTHLRIKGLMTLAPLTDQKVMISDCFKRLKDLREELKEKFRETPHVSMQSLSMGMSDDYEIALQQGSNMIRIGRAIFD